VTTSANPNPGRRRQTLGYEVLPSGHCRITLRGFPREVVPDELAARLRVVELETARRDGNALPPPTGSRLRTLGECARACLAHVLAHGGRNGELTAAGAKHWRFATRPWIDGPLAPRPLRSLTRAELQEAIDARTRTNRVSARNEAHALLAILKHAQGDDIEFPASLLAIAVPKKTKKSRVDLTTANFDFLLSEVDPRSRRVFELASTLGNRISELLVLERQWVSLNERRIVLPLEATKEKREKRLDLTDEETEIVRRQLLEVYGRFGPDTRYVFPRPRGGRFDYTSFYEQVWTPAKQRAQVAWLAQRGYDNAFELVKRRRALNERLRQTGDRALVAELDTLPTTPFDRVTLHTLRRTAVSWLRASRLPVEIIAQRLGHSDGGATLLAHYTAEARAGQVRAALDGLGPGVRSRLRELEGPTDEEEQLG
jgi:integrase